MRLVTWNVNGALRRKWDALTRLEPDVAVLQEVAERDLRLLAPQSVWAGNLAYKGLGVVGFNGWTPEVLPCWDSRIEFVVPFRVSRDTVEFTLMAVWAMGPRAEKVHPDRPERGQLRQALDLYGDLFRNGPVIVAGDFNNAVFWDKPGRQANHALAVEDFGALDMVSAYHAHAPAEQGREGHPTLYWTWNRERRYHIDYIWLPEAWSRGITVGVGDYDTWVGGRLSDHVPVTAEFSIA